MVAIGEVSKYLLLLFSCATAHLKHFSRSLPKSSTPKEKPGADDRIDRVSSSQSCASSEAVSSDIAISAPPALDSEEKGVAEGVPLLF